ncbi:SRPBCC family protein [Rhodococcus sp. 077-4]|uniref:SRPBCC family protein n=1 Tax=Rhodococcus sp. 077-4 TaxID=2789271 RepID=UPI0039F56332
MTSMDPSLDLTISRVIAAPRASVWSAWIDPSKFEKWWIPAPALCRVDGWDPTPGGAFRTSISESGGEFAPHIDGCFLAVDERERIVFTNSLVEGWRPAPQLFMTAVITFSDHPDGTNYQAHVMHRNEEDRKMHEENGFHDGWGTVIAQLAGFVES